MHTFTVLTLLGLALVSQSALATVVIDQPWSPSVWQAGRPEQIHYRVEASDEGDAAAPERLQVMLLHGDPDDAHYVKTIDASVDPMTSALTWEVPKDLPQGKDYFVGIDDGSGRWAFSHKFQVENPHPVASMPTARVSSKETSSPSKSSSTPEESDGLESDVEDDSSADMESLAASTVQPTPEPSATEESESELNSSRHSWSITRSMTNDHSSHRRPRPTNHADKDELVDAGESAAAVFRPGHGLSLVTVAGLLLYTCQYS
ncbi:hypothetical protein H4R34_001433 [Dimargaris verticillata]|uniref:Yeast cell wall synthesis Kre9/Knh1-like N-terminal domain-containing protein n=1 Tax=Dimargaris verticillata TaxID=2761393 RepID=A0A9W8B677_9FUNG|nr:hypothetical protein H4R34_001433 [Dimargaris verticillata]